MKKMTPQVQMSFREIYDAIPRAVAVSPKDEFITRIAQLTMKSESAVRGWIAGAYQPDALTQSVLEKELGVSASVLFPKKEEQTA